ncbi:hypothetical protein [Spirosoma flavum]|uniref:Uncharacterized protein n=1 Tax=Spirosoma flavum TaxID=2048557 RepID=A0ABW6AF13_9BACT
MNSHIAWCTFASLLMDGGTRINTFPEIMKRPGIVSTCLDGQVQ